MEALLDTHVVVWWLEAASELSSRALRWLSVAGNTFYISAAVGWEVSIKTNLGKFQHSELVSDMAGQLEQEGWKELPISLEHAIRAGQLPLHHRDPFDRILVAQAQALNLPVISGDRTLDRYDVRRLW